MSCLKAPDLFEMKAKHREAETVKVLDGDMVAEKGGVYDCNQHFLGSWNSFPGGPENCWCWHNDVFRVTHLWWFYFVAFHDPWQNGHFASWAFGWIVDVANTNLPWRTWSVVYQSSLFDLLYDSWLTCDVLLIPCRKGHQHIFICLKLGSKIDSHSHIGWPFNLLHVCGLIYIYIHTFYSYVYLLHLVVYVSIYIYIHTYIHKWHTEHPKFLGWSVNPLVVAGRTSRRDARLFGGGVECYNWLQVQISRGLSFSHQPWQLENPPLVFPVNNGDFPVFHLCLPGGMY